MTDPVVEDLQRREVVSWRTMFGVRDRKTAIVPSWRKDEGSEFHNGRWACNDEDTGEFLGIDDDPHVLADRLGIKNDYITGLDEFYFNCHLVMCREYGKTPWGAVFSGQWVVRDIRNGELIDNSMYINDLIDKYNFPTENKE